jgi:phosphoenolpyruvate carboxylase
MDSLRLAPFTRLVQLPASRRRLKLARCTVRGAQSESSASAKAVAGVVSASSGAEERRPADAHPRRQLAPEKVPADDRLAGYETLLVARFLDILQGLHGGDSRQVVEECLRLSGEYHVTGDPARLDELGAFLTSLDVGDAVMVASSFSHMLSLANIAEEVQMAYRNRAETDRRGGGFADEASASTESDIDETLQRLVVGLGKTPREVFDALRAQTIDIVLTAHPTQSVRRSLLQKHARSVTQHGTAELS